MCSGLTVRCKSDEFATFIPPSVTSMASAATDTLSRDIVLSINRILDIQPSAKADPLDDLSEDFDPIQVLNRVFPDGLPASRHLGLYYKSLRSFYAYL